MMECVDGEYQVFKARGGAYVREHFFGADPVLLERVAHLSDEQIGALHRGGHDPAKVYAAYAPRCHTGRPTVILAKTVKGYAAWARPARPPTPTTSRRRWRIRPCARSATASPSRCPTISWSRFRTSSRRPAAPSRPISTRPSSARAAICRAVRPAPARWPRRRWRPSPRCSRAARAASSRPRWVRLLGQLLKDPGIGKRVVPIVPDESRTFGMDAMFRQVGIYSHVGQLRAAGRRPAQCLPRGPPGADPAGRHQRVRRHGILDRGRHGAQHAWAGDDPVLHLLFDVRLPARGRPGLGRRRHPRARFPPGRDLGPHHAGRRGPAARRRPQPRAGLGDPVAAPTTRPMPTRSR